MPDADMSQPLQLDRYLPYRLSVLSNTVSGAIARLYETEFGLTISEWRILAVLGPAAAGNSPLSANEVAGQTRMDKVQVSRAVARLLDKGLLRRSVAADDRRRTELSLSRRGEKVYDRVAPRTVDWEQRLLANLRPQELEQFDRTLTKLQAIADEMADDADIVSD